LFWVGFSPHTQGGFQIFFCHVTESTYSPSQPNKTKRRLKGKKKSRRKKEKKKKRKKKKKLGGPPPLGEKLGANDKVGKKLWGENRE